ncbi:MAG: phenylalanine--tRNA ligase subunit alpha [Planctomycetota bacterium]|nr:phenylalanine--tRNA ligase subunit alpha [Planctomycetota bacterium]
MAAQSVVEAAERLQRIANALSEGNVNLEALYEEALAVIEPISEEEHLLEELEGKQLEVVKRVFLFRKGALNQLFRFISLLPDDLKRRVGAAINRTKSLFETLLKKEEEEEPIKFDVTVPGRSPEVGRRHIITRTIEEICNVMRQLGFSYTEGPEVEDEYHNFVALNIPEHHLARDEKANFYITDTLLLRSQTSPVQIRYMESHKPPIRVFAPGRVYRPDTVDASHYYAFHQVEGLWVDEGISFAHLKTTLLLFSRLMVGEDVKVRLRPSFFPFTEPSAEIDFSCFVCGGKGCPTCGKKGWLEIGGCGMVNPNVLRYCRIDPERYTGFAFGIGIDRIVMALYGINDIRLLFQNDIRFLEQF